MYIDIEVFFLLCIKFENLYSKALLETDQNSKILKKERKIRA